MKELKKVPDLSIIFDMGVVALRFLMPVYAIIIVYQCFAGIGYLLPQCAVAAVPKLL